MRLSLASSTLALEKLELGRMGPFENPLLAHLEEEYGFTPNQNWLDSLKILKTGFVAATPEDVLRLRLDYDEGCPLHNSSRPRRMSPTGSMKV